MINFEIADSPFFKENKKYIEKILTNCERYQPSYEGFCNSFGFDVEIKFSKENKQYQIKLQQRQSTHNGIIVPVNAKNNLENVIRINNFPSDENIKISKSSVQRIFMNQVLKDIFAIPYFAKLSDVHLAQSLCKFVSKYDIESLELSNRKLKLKTFQKIENIEIIEEIESIFHKN